MKGTQRLCAGPGDLAGAGASDPGPEAMGSCSAGRNEEGHARSGAWEEWRQAAKREGVLWEAVGAGQRALMGGGQPPAARGQ